MRVTKEQKAEIIAMAKDGSDIVGICIATETNKSTVKRTLKKAGLFTPRGYKRKEEPKVLKKQPAPIEPK